MCNRCLRRTLIIALQTNTIGPLLFILKRLSCVLTYDTTSLRSLLVKRRPTFPRSFYTAPVYRGRRRDTQCDEKKHWERCCKTGLGAAVLQTHVPYKFNFGKCGRETRHLNLDGTEKALYVKEMRVNCRDVTTVFLA